MASHEFFYNTQSLSSPSSAPPNLTTQMPVSPMNAGSQLPPRPPPKPIPQNNAQSTDPNRSETPNFIPMQTSPMTAPTPDISRMNVPPGLPPPVPPYPSHNQQTASYTTDMNNNNDPQSSSIIQQSFTPQQYQQHNPQGESIMPQPPPSLSTPYLPDSLPSKSTIELQPLLNNPSLISALAQTHPSYKSAVSYLNAAISANLNTATQVAYAEAQLRQLRAQTAQLLLNHASLQTQWRRKQAEMDDALSPWGPRVMYQRLVSSIAEQEAVLKAVQESFLEGHHDEAGHVDGKEHSFGRGGTSDGKASEREVNDWVKRIREGTTVLEKRRAMRARWDEGRVGGWR